MKKTLLFSLFLAFGAQFSSAQTADQYPSDVPNILFEHALNMIKVTPGFTPPVASRALGYLGTTTYESVVGGNPGHLPLSGRILGLNNVTASDPQLTYHWPTVVNNALAYVIDSLFFNAPAAQLTTLRHLRDSINGVNQAALDAATYQRSEQLGINIGMDIFNFSKTDGAYRAQTANFPAYTPPVGPEMWVPLAGQSALQPYWGTKRPFLAVDTSANCVPGMYPAFDTLPGTTFYDFGMQVYTTSNNLTQAQTDIALFYADGGGTITPPGHSFNVLRQILVDENSNLAFACEAYARVGNALADAFRVCWKTKYIYNLLRPITYINRHIDPNWTPLIGTPPFPEYTSGHSSQSGAWAETMEALFGQNYAFVDNTHGANFGGPRGLGSFDEWAAEAAVSRLYGGIHYEFSNYIGVAFGTVIGQNINDFFATLLTDAQQPALDIAEVAVSPNPSNGLIHLVGDLSRASQIDVYNYAGTHLASMPVSNDLDLSNLSSGIYILRATGEGFTRVSRVVISR